MAEVIRVEELTKKYGQLAAVDRVNFSVQEGEVFGYLGPNGAGKTTTIRILVGLTSPTSGEAFLNGVSILASDLCRGCPTAISPGSWRVDSSLAGPFDSGRLYLNTLPFSAKGFCPEN